MVWPEHWETDLDDQWPGEVEGDEQVPPPVEPAGRTERCALIVAAALQAHTKIKPPCGEADAVDKRIRYLIDLTGASEEKDPNLFQVMYKYPIMALVLFSNLCTNHWCGAAASLVVLHAVAHVTQLGNADAFSMVDYYDEWRGIVQEVYVECAQSGKKRFGAFARGHQLGTGIVQFWCGLCRQRCAGERRARLRRCGHRGGRRCGPRLNISLRPAPRAGRCSCYHGGTSASPSSAALAAAVGSAPGRTGRRREPLTASFLPQHRVHTLTSPRKLSVLLPFQRVFPFTHGHII